MFTVTACFSFPFCYCRHWGSRQARSPPSRTCALALPAILSASLSQASRFCARESVLLCGAGAASVSPLRFFCECACASPLFSPVFGEGSSSFGRCLPLLACACAAVAFPSPTSPLHPPNRHTCPDTQGRAAQGRSAAECSLPSSTRSVVFAAVRVRSLCLRASLSLSLAPSSCGSPPLPGHQRLLCYCACHPP